VLREALMSLGVRFEGVVEWNAIRITRAAGYFIFFEIF
jgi:hypothetical protein